MRSVAVLVAGCAILVSAGSSPAALSAPKVRVAGAGTLTVVGSGFAPRSLVRLRVTGHGLDRRSAVRAGVGGGFVVRFAGLARCAPREITAVADNGRRARVSVSWFLRECPPPPPLDPGTPVS